MSESARRRPDNRPVEEVMFPALLEDDIDDLYDNAPCGFLSTLLDGTIAKVNATLLDWLGRSREELVGRCRFVDLLATGSRHYHETHFAPLLRMQGQMGGVALELRTAEGASLPVLVTSAVKTGGDGERDQGHRHCTVIFGVLEKEGAGYTASIAAGGHPPALVVRANGGTDYQTTDGGTLIGILAEPRVATRTIRLDPGDTLILYNDGLTEARTAPHGERFGDDALRDFVESEGPTEAAAAVSALTGLLAGFDEVDDDVAVMAFSVSRE